jgi:hypothetical protein
VKEAAGMDQPASEERCVYRLGGISAISGAVFGGVGNSSIP